jgi:uncharacterized protein YndB with AHSA1/START domain
MLKIIGIVLVVAVAGFLIYVAMQPEDFRIQRTTTVNAPPERIYPLITDFRGWGAWSPWEKKDPAMKRTFSGPESGVGAAYAWEGDKNVGTGKMTILEATAPGKVVIKLEFLKPFEATNTAEFTLQPQGDSTTINWAMYGKNKFLSKLVCVFMSMEKMVGPDFEAGLAGLKALAEKPAA